MRKGDGSVDLVGLAAELAEHVACVGFVVRFAEHLSVEPDNCVRSDQQVVGSKRVVADIRFRLGSGDKRGYIAALQVVRVGFVGIDADFSVRDIQAGKQFAAARRLGAEDDVH